MIVPESIAACSSAIDAAPSRSRQGTEPSRRTAHQGGGQARSSSLPDRGCASRRVPTRGCTRRLRRAPRGRHPRRSSGGVRSTRQPSCDRSALPRSRRARQDRPGRAASRSSRRRHRDRERDATSDWLRLPRTGPARRTLRGSPGGRARRQEHRVDRGHRVAGCGEGASEVACAATDRGSSRAAKEAVRERSSRSPSSRST